MDTRGFVALSNVWPGAGMTRAWCEGVLPLSVRACLAFDVGPTCATRQKRESSVAEAETIESRNLREASATVKSCGIRLN